MQQPARRHLSRIAHFWGRHTVAHGLPYSVGSPVIGCISLAL